MTLREKLLLLKEEGISFAFIAKQTGFHRNTLNCFVRGESGLSKEAEAKVESLVNKLLECVLTKEC